MNKTTYRRNRSILTRAMDALTSMFDPRALVHGLRLIHYYNYTHVSQKRLMTLGQKVRIAPNVSFANGERITLGDGVQLGARCTLWAGDETGRIEIGADTTFGPECFLTASNYGSEPGIKLVDQAKDEKDIVIGADCWLGTRVIVTAGVTIGEGTVVGAGSVVTRDLPPNSIAAGIPAKVLKTRAE